MFWPSLWYEIGVLWANIKHIKSHATALDLWFQTDINQIFQMSYFSLFQVKRLQKCLRSKKNLLVQPGSRRSCRIGPSWQFSVWPPNLTLVFLQPLDLRTSIVTHLKNLIHICLELETQNYGMTFNVCCVGSKYPFFISNRGSCQNRSDEHCVIFSKKFSFISTFSIRKKYVFHKLIKIWEGMELKDRRNFSKEILG